MRMSNKNIEHRLFQNFPFRDLDPLHLFFIENQVTLTFMQSSINEYGNSYDTLARYYGPLQLHGKRNIKN